MLSGYGWCILRASREAYRGAHVRDVPNLDASVDAADRTLWGDFRDWMAKHETPWLKWHFYEHLNNESGILLFCISRNHRSSPVWEMIDWIAVNGTGSYGFFFAHDDEDVAEYDAEGNGAVDDYSNVFRVHRILNGAVTVASDPFFGPITPAIDPPHPYDRESDA